MTRHEELHTEMLEILVCRGILPDFFFLCRRPLRGPCTLSQHIPHGFLCFVDLVYRA
jgi:hypothetical protein